MVLGSAQEVQLFSGQVHVMPPPPVGGHAGFSLIPSQRLSGYHQPFRVSPTLCPKAFSYTSSVFVYTSGYFISDPPKLPSKVSENPFSHWALIVQENFHIIYAGKHRKNPHGPANTETVTELNLGGSGGM